MKIGLQPPTTFTWHDTDHGLSGVSAPLLFHTTITHAYGAFIVGMCSYTTDGLIETLICVTIVHFCIFSMHSTPLHTHTHMQSNAGMQVWADGELQVSCDTVASSSYV